MKRVDIILLLMTSIIVIIGAGCSTSGIEVEAASGIVSSEKELKQSVDYNNISLKRKVKVVDLRSFTVGNLMKAQAFIVSKSRRTMSLQYKFLWFDSNGMEIDTGSKAWNPIVVHGKESRSIQSVAQNPAAQWFRVKIRVQK